MTRKRFLLLALILAAAAAGGLFLWRFAGPVTLRVGFWAGSWWDVPTADSYAVLDAAIAKFEAAHPGVRVEYVSGLLKRDYTEWLLGRALMGRAPDVLLIPPDDFYDICRRVTRDTDGDNVIDQFGCCNYTWREALFANGGSLFQNGGSFCDLTSGEMIQAVSFTAGLNALSEEHAVTAKEFEAGRVAFRPMLFSEYRAYQSYPWRIKKYSRFVWDCLKMPAGSSGGNISEMTSLQMGISSQSHHKDLAWELLQTLTCDEEIQRKIYTDSQGCSPLVSIIAAPETAEILRRATFGDGKLDLAMLDEVLASAVTVPRFQNFSQVTEMIDARVAEALKSTNDVRLLLTSAQVEINRMLRN